MLPAAPIFAESWELDLEPVRPCLRSGDHELNHVRVLADPAAAPIYLSRTGELPEGSLVLKVEYGFSDDACTGPITGFSAMRKDGGGPGGWTFQRTDARLEVLETNGARCHGCHRDCDEFFDHTCAERDAVPSG